MSLQPRRPSRLYTLHNPPFPRLWRAFAGWMGRNRGLLLGLILGALLVLWLSIDARARLVAERDAAVQAAEQIAAWHQHQWVRVVLEGKAAQVANLAGQVSAVVR